MKKTVYYAHPMYLYGKPQEKRDVLMLEEMGFEVINPNQEIHQTGYSEYRKGNPENPMKYFTDLAGSCDVIAFRAFPDGKIGGGVYLEVVENMDKPHFELPRMIKARGLDHETTVRHLEELGQR